MPKSVAALSLLYVSSPFIHSGGGQALDEVSRRSISSLRFLSIYSLLRGQALDEAKVKYKNIAIALDANLKFIEI